MKKEENLRITKYEYSAVNSIGQNITIAFGVAHNQTMDEDMRIISGLLEKAQAELSKDIADTKNKPQLVPPPSLN